MNRILTGALVLGMMTHGGCSRCTGSEPVMDGSSLDVSPEPSTNIEVKTPPERLAKHDWNGITVMMRESEVREALWAIGFSLTASRQDTFPILSEDGHDVRLVPIQGFSPPLVAFETEKHESPLGSVYGLRLYFHRNRLYSFQPVYYANPVDLVDPGDEAVPPDVMISRLTSTFGEPAYSNSSGDHEVMTWDDKDLFVLFRRPVESTLPTYDLQFFSPRGNKLVTELVDRLTKKKP